jgi:DNA mismatch repair protein MutS2
LNAHALDAIEFPRIRELLVSRASSAPGRARAARLAPLDDRQRLDWCLGAVGEALALQYGRSGWGPVAFPDARESIGQARVMGSVLEAGPLEEIAQLLRRASAVASFFATEEQRAERPRLSEIARAVFVDRDFPALVDRTFEPSGEVRDSASPRLRELRREHRRAQQRVSEQLEQMSRRFRGSGEDSFVTLRGGRYVVSVAVSEKRHAAGIVHDRSATGHTVYLEPFEIVESNNAIAELEADERQEVRRILAELTGWVRANAAALEETIEALARLDECDARARLAQDLRATRPAIDDAAATLRLVAARHPLLHLTLGPRTVALDLTLEGSARGLVVSGPNMGGKTVVLKTVGLTVAMALAGLYVPAADGTVVPWIDELFVDIGDEQSLESDLSTYAARLRNMKSALDAAGARSLVLIDELGGGTDPEEGAALGRALLEEIGRRGAFCVVTTHHGAFKAFAAETAGYANAAAEYDTETLRPTYRLRIGLPGRSHAFELARREGWPAEVLENASRFVSEGALRTESLLRQIDAQRQSLEGLEVSLREERAAAGREREHFGKLSTSMRERIDALRSERALEEDRRLRELRGLLREMRERLTGLPETATAEELTEIRRWFHERERQTADLAKTVRPVRRPRATPLGPLLSAARLVPGARALSRSLGVEVTVIEAGADGIRVEHRGRRIALPAGDLHEPAAGETAAAAAPERPVVLHSAAQSSVAEAVSSELDLRGLSVEECLERLDLYLDRVLLSGLHQVRIIHGKGQGILRREVQRYLKDHPAVTAFRDGEPGEGGWGVTIAFLGGAPGAGAGEAG